MIPYKINFIKTDLKEITQEDIYNKSYQVFYLDKFFDVVDVDEEFYVILDLNLEQQMKNAPMGMKISKSLITEFYKPVIELVDESYNQLLLNNELKVVEI